MSIDEQLNQFLAPVSKVLSDIMFISVPVAGTEVPLIVVWLIMGSVVFTLYLRFVNIRGFRLALAIVRGDYAKPGDDGEVSHFQALTAALSGTVGLGNIAGVAVAISIGGPGATLWMIVAGFLGMSLKFAECTLAVKYRRVNAEGVVSGGPMYYLRAGLAKRGWPRLGRGVAAFFAVACIGGSLTFFQANQSFQQFSATTGFDTGWLYGLVMALLVGVVIIGGIKSIARVTAKLVPLMCGIYLLAAITVLLTHFTQIPATVLIIVKGAFAPEAVHGGIIGVLIQGFRRAAYSSEAGIGSAPIAHAAVRTDEPVTEGLVALLEPFIDTVVVCTMTALVIVVTGMYQTPGVDGVSLTSAAFASVIGWFPAILTVAVVLFAFSTIISWSYYGLKAWTYLWGDSTASEITFKLLICATVVMGPVMELYAVIDLVDSLVFAMAVPNIFGLYLMAPEVRRELDSFLRRVQSGEIRPARDRRAVATENN